MRGISAVALAIAGCSSAAAPPAPRIVESTRIIESTPKVRSCKPEAPVALVAELVPIDARRARLTVQATPTAAVDALELALVLPAEVTLLDGAPALRTGAIGAGESRTLAATLRLDGRAADVAAVARVPVDGVVMARAATVHLGAEPPWLRSHTYALPDGELAREVRP